MLCRALEFVLAYAAQVWPPQHGLAMKIDSLQRHFVGSALGVVRLPCEEFGTFCKRRSRAASRIIEAQNAWWTKRWYQRAITWDDHCRPDLQRQEGALNLQVEEALIVTRFAWPGQLLDWKGEDFLQSKRTFFSRNSCFVSLCWATQTRVVRGKVQRRWHEGVARAKNQLL